MSGFDKEKMAAFHEKVQASEQENGKGEKDILFINRDQIDALDPERAALAWNNFAKRITSGHSHAEATSLLQKDLNEIRRNKGVEKSHQPELLMADTYDEKEYAAKRDAYVSELKQFVQGRVREGVMHESLPGWLTNGETAKWLPEFGNTRFPASRELSDYTDQYIQFRQYMGHLRHAATDPTTMSIPINPTEEQKERWLSLVEEVEEEIKDIEEKGIPEQTLIIKRHKHRLRQSYEEISQMQDQELKKDGYPL